jgi:hypothetical protein
MKSNQLIIVLLLVAAGSMETNARAFGDALKRKEISYEVTSTSGPRRMLLRIKNLTGRTTRVDLEPGRFFYNTPTVQPFVIARPVAIALDPGEEREVLLRAFCGNSSAQCPTDNLKFNRTELGPENLSTLLKYMTKQQITGDNLYQQVIWFYSNKHQIASIYSGQSDPKSNEMVRNFICAKEGIKIPKYTIQYAQALSGDELEFSGRPDEVKAKLNFTLANRSDLHVRVLDEQGKQIETIEVHLNQPAGMVELPVAVKVSDYPFGHYTIAISDEKGNVLSTMAVVVS